MMWNPRLQSSGDTSLCMDRMIRTRCRGRGLQVYLLEKGKQFREMKRRDQTDDALQDGVDGLMKRFIDVQRGGPTARKRIINYIW